MLTLSDLLPSTIILSVSLYLINFFGRAISDQTPFADNRKWNRDLEGLLFFCFHIVTPIAGVLIFVKSGYNLTRLDVNDIILLSITAIILGYLKFVAKKANEFFHKTKPTEESGYYYLQFYLFSIFEFFIIYVIFDYYRRTQYLYIIPSLSLLFMYLLEFSLFRSLKKENILMANIYFIDDNNPIIDCRILKVNSDNVRIMKDNCFIIINKSQIFKIEEKMNTDL